jgi:conjugal transfer mating pair stabilization protein TraN
MKSTEFEGCKCPNGKKDCDRSEIDPKSCRFFRGDSFDCTRYTAQHNCCSEKGMLRQLAACDAPEKDLFTKRKAKLCHHVHTLKEGFLSLAKKQSHCCFKSKLARIIQVAGRKQLGIGWGSDLENPDCRGLTLEEIRRIDFSKIDFSEIFNKVKAKAQSAANAKKDEMAAKMQEFKDSGKNLSDMSELINKKINKFYTDARN